jgi:outer membrane protein
VSARRTAEIALKQLIVSGTNDPNWNFRIDPVDRPEFVPEPIDLDAAIRRALTARTDLSAAKKTLQANDVTYKFLRNQTLPQADLVARYGLAGVGGEKFVRNSTTGLTTVAPGGLGDAVSSLFNNNFPQWSVGVNFSMPIGYNVATTSVAQAKLEMSQTAAQVNQIELQIATDVTNAVTNIQSDVEAVQAAQAALELAQQTYEAEQAKLDVGLSTNYNVILDLNALNTVKNSYLQAVLAYRNALVELDRLQQTTLQTAGVTLLATSTLVAPAPIGSAR